MFIFYGLGNNQEKYFQTKHNAGRIVLEKYLELENLKFQEKESYSWTKQDDFYFLISKGFMNNSGLAILNFKKYFKLNLSDPTSILIILQDDSDQYVGKQKLVIGGGSAGHRGTDDIYKQSLNLELNLNQIWRLKIGIRPEENKQKSETFVLANINNFEKEHYQKLAKKIHESKELFRQRKISKLQNIFNTNS